MILANETGFEPALQGFGDLRVTIDTTQMWRVVPDSNRQIYVLQTQPLPFWQPPMYVIE